MLRRFLPGARLALFTRLWRSYATRETIKRRLDALPGEPIPDLVTLRRMASELDIRRPVGFATVVHARRRTAKLPPHVQKIAVEAAIRSAFLVRRQEKTRRRQLRKLEPPKTPKPTPIMHDPMQMAVPAWLKKQRRNVTQRAWRAKRKAEALASKPKAQQNRMRRHHNGKRREDAETHGRREANERIEQIPTGGRR